ncbi:peptidase A4 family-domain-containing protein, partial [Lentinula raphanica]
MMLKVLTATLLLTSVLSSTDARPMESRSSSSSGILRGDELVSDIWSGVTVLAPRSDPIDVITGRFHLPDVPHNLRTTEAEAAFWVGISGDPLPQLVQAGVVMRVSKHGALTFHGFYEWYPDTARWVEDSQLDLHVGDEIEVSIWMLWEGREARILITNHTNGKYFEQRGFIISKSLRLRFYLARIPIHTIYSGTKQGLPNK